MAALTGNKATALIDEAEDEEADLEEDRFSDFEIDEGETFYESTVASPLFAPYLSLPDIAAACAHDMEMYGFDVKATGQRLQLDFYGAIRFVNWLRAEVAKVGPTEERPLAVLDVLGILVPAEPGAAFLSDDAFLKPFMEGDVFLQNLDKYVVGKEEDDEDWSDDDGDNEQGKAGGGGGRDEAAAEERGASGGGPSVSSSSPSLPMGMSVEQENQLLKQQLTALRAQLSVASELAKRNLDSGGDTKKRSNNKSSSSSLSSSSPLKGSSSGAAASDDGSDDSGGSDNEGAPDTDTYYFNSYSHVGIHETMLRDESRTGGYARAIFDNPQLFEGKAVLDVGCGSGVLSMFAARAGARKVVGIDCSSILFSARQNVELNGLSHVVKLVYGKCEDLSRSELGLEEGEAFDVIVSEWMGYGLLYESMLPSVLHARDTLMRRKGGPAGEGNPAGVLKLKSGTEENAHPFAGTMWPNRATLYINGWSDAGGADAAKQQAAAAAAGPVRGAARLHWWKDVHGVNLSALAPMLLTEPSVEVCRAGEAAATSRAVLWDVDLNACADGDLDFEVPFELTMQPMQQQQQQGGGAGAGKGAGSDAAKLDGFVVAFDVAFLGPQATVHLKTGADSPPTHWKQALCLLDPAQAPPPDALRVGDKVTGSYAMRRSKKNPRDYVIAIVWNAGGCSGAQTFVLGS
jgi:SAM-dependent methyltransferase